MEIIIGGGGGGGSMDPFSLIGRSGQVNLNNGVDSIAVIFTTPLASSNYSVVVTLQNTADADPIWLIPLVTAQSNTGFTASFNAATDSVNYRLNYLVAGVL